MVAVRSSKPWVASALALLLAACGGQKTAVVAPPLPDLPTWRVESAAGAPARGWDGIVEAVRWADLSAQTSGRVEQVLFDVNDRVSAGTVLLRLASVEQDAGVNSALARLRASEALLVEAEQTLARYAALSDANHVSRAQLDQARAARDSAIASRDAARALLAQARQQAAYTIVRAPFDGIVARRDVEPGESVAPGRSLMAVYVPGELRIEVAIPQTRADLIRRDARAQVQLPDGRRVTPASVVVFPAADVASHSVNVRVVLPTLEPLPVPGTTAKVRFEADAATDGTPVAASVWIPAAAVAQRGELSAAYVRDGERLLLRQLRLGARHGDVVEVISGVQADDLVVLDPAAATQALIARRQATGARHD